MDNRCEILRMSHGGFELVGVWMEGSLDPAILSSN